MHLGSSVSELIARLRQAEEAFERARSARDQARQALSEVLAAAPAPERPASGPDEEIDFKHLVEHLPDMVTIHDRALRHVYINAVGTDISGIPSEAFFGKTHVELGMPEAAVAFFTGHLARVFASGRNEEVEFLDPVHPENGRHYHTLLVPQRDADGGVSHVVTVTREITAMKRVEAALRHSEARLKEAQQVADLGSWEWEIAENRVTWSGQLYVIFGVDPATFVPTYEHFLERVHPDDRQAVASAIEQVLAGQDGFKLDHRIVRPDGEVRVLHGRSRVERGEDGAPRRMIGISQDVTERRQAELALARAEAQRRQLEKLEELDRLKRDFLNAASHELRTPLTSIIGYCEFLEDELGGPLSEVQREFIDRIREGGHRLSQIVDDMLDFARLEAGTFQLVPQEVDMIGLVGRELALLRPQARRAGVNLEVALPEAPLPMRVDRTRIGQVLLNLAGNAIKFTPEGGTVTVTLDRTADGVRISVHDTGIGIPSEQLEQVFEKFYQVDRGTTRRHGGTGLGLAISKALVEAHGGAIGAESAPGQGSTFWFTLPGG